MVKIKNIWNHHLDNLNQFHLDFLIPPQKNKDETTAFDCQTVHHADVSVAFDSNFDSHGLQKSETSKMDHVFCGWSPRSNPLKYICSKTSRKLVTKIINKHAAMLRAPTVKQLDWTRPGSKPPQFYVSTAAMIQSAACLHWSNKLCRESTFQAKMERKLNVLWLSSMIAVMD